MRVGTADKEPVRSYQDLIVWQKAMALAETTYRATAQFPKEEVYGLVSKMRRAAVSITSNIAEGQACSSRGEFVQFLGHAKGSLAELETQTLLSKRLGLLPSDVEPILMASLGEVGRLLNGLLASLKPKPSTTDH